MIHSRPGYAPRTSDDAPAKLNIDMIPAINRTANVESTTLKETLQTKADKAHAKLIAERALEDAQVLASRLSLGPEILVNPLTTEPPRINEPGK
jgi:hypothetical protein